MRWITLILCAFLLVGCKSAPAPDTLIGMNQEEVVDTLGDPTKVTEETQPGPEVLNAPEGLHQGEPYTQMYYENIDGQWWMVFLADPAIYERVTSHKPDGTDRRVFRVLLKASKATNGHWSLDEWWHDPFIDRPGTTIVH